jgi:hypothetical protein
MKNQNGAELEKSVEEVTCLFEIKPKAVAGV